MKFSRIIRNLRIVYKSSYLFEKKLEKDWNVNLNNHRKKDKALIYLGEKYGITHLIETGTNYGETLWALRHYFNTITSIELEDVRYYSTRRRFKKYGHIGIIYGDSGEILKTIINDFKEPVLFWLDAHYDGGNTAIGKLNTPIISELETILNTTLEHIVLIDDANTFIDQLRPDYPTLKELEFVVNTYKKNYRVFVKDNMIWVEKQI
jgi:hypothetical protein